MRDSIGKDVPVLIMTLFGLGILMTMASGVSAATSLPTAAYAHIDYDVVYVRCPRANPTVVRPDGSGEVLDNWNGVNDLWLSASNNIYQQPGCDLVLHHSDPGYGGSLPDGDRGREEVLVNCDEGDPSLPICTVADPNVSFDGRYVVYTKFTDTRQFIADEGISGGGGWGATEHLQSFMRLYPLGDGPGGVFAARVGGNLKPFAAPALIYRYDLLTHTETRVSPAEKFFAGRAHPGRGSEWQSNIPVMDTGPFFMPDGRIGFTSNRNSGFYKFQLFAMDADGKNLELLGHRAMSQQLHPAVLKDGRIMYTSNDTMLQKSTNNQYSLFTINPDGSFPFILAGKHDATHRTYHYATQLSDGDVVVTLYYNHNNGAMGTLLRFPIDPPGADFEHIYGSMEHPRPFDPSVWFTGVNQIPFARKGQFILTPEANGNDAQARPYTSSNQYWIHPSDGRTVTMQGRFTHPAAAPDNDLLVTYTIGGSSTMPNPYFTNLGLTMQMIGKDAGIWLVPLDAASTRQVGDMSVDGRIIVDFPEYHEIMARAVVPYNRIYGVARPGVDFFGVETDNVKVTQNQGTQDPRLPAGAPYGLTGAASLYDRETRSVNGTPWNAADGGGVKSGRTYLNLAASGADLAIFNNDEIYGIRVLMPEKPVPNGYAGGVEEWAGVQNHHLRVLGEYPVRKPSGTPLDLQGNPDTSFIVRVPADTPFLLQTLDKNGMALDIETASRTVVRGEQQLCAGCHVHTRTGQDAFSSLAKRDTASFGDFTGDSAPLFSGLDSSGNPVVKKARDIYPGLPGIDARRSFGVDWEHGVNQILQNRCASCHGEGKSAQQATGLRLDGDDRTYDLLVNNKYIREDNVKIDYNTLPGDGLDDVINNTPGTDRITRHYSCCTATRWLALNSARSSMLIWALYGERMDGRDPATGLPPAGSGILVDTKGAEHPEVWPKVAEHAAYVAGMPEEEKRLLARWIDLGAPKTNIHDDLARPVLTLTPVVNAGAVDTVLVGVWDDSALDYSRFEVRHNGSVIMSGADIVGTPSVISVPLPVNITDSNASANEFEFEIWDKPDRSLSLVNPGVAAANRTHLTVDGHGLLRMVGASTNHAPTSTSATIDAVSGVESFAIPYVTDPDVGDTHLISFVAQPGHGSTYIDNNRLVYVSDPGYVGSDSFRYQVHDLGGLTVSGSATVTVTAPPAPPTAGDSGDTPGGSVAGSTGGGAADSATSSGGTATASGASSTSGGGSISSGGAAVASGAANGGGGGGGMLGIGELLGIFAWGSLVGWVSRR